MHLFVRWSGVPTWVWLGLLLLVSLVWRRFLNAASSTCFALAAPPAGAASLLAEIAEVAKAVGTATWPQSASSTLRRSMPNGILPGMIEVHACTPEQSTGTIVRHPRVTPVGAVASADRQSRMAPLTLCAVRPQKIAPACFAAAFRTASPHGVSKPEVTLTTPFIMMMIIMSSRCWNQQEVDNQWARLNARADPCVVEFGLNVCQIYACS
jgi:hypothetical protein